MRAFDEAVLFENPIEFGYDLQEVAMAPDMQRRYMVHPHDKALGRKEVFLSYLEVMVAVDLKKVLKQKVLDAYGI